MGRLVRDDRKATVTQITTRYNQGMQHTISERTTRRTLKKSPGLQQQKTTPGAAPVSYEQETEAKYRTGSPKLDNRRLENVAWSDESQFLLRHSDGRVRIWHKEHESMDPSCLVSTVQAGGGVIVWGIFFWDTLYQLSIV